VSGLASNVQFAEFAVMRVIFAVFLTFASLTLTGASRPLNPLVPRISGNSAISTECADGSVAPAPRIDLAQLSEPDLSAAEAELLAPPSGGLRVQLRDAQAALDRDDRRGFADALSRLRTTLADYPSGGERTVARHVLDVYEDAAVLWDAQFQSPFFSEESAAYRAASSYPGWAEGVRRNVLVDDRDRRFYPARESRQYLGTVALTRLKQLGVRSPSTESPRLERDEPAPAVALPAIRPKRRPGKVETHTAEAPASRAPRPLPPIVHMAAHAQTTRNRSTAAPAVKPAAPAPTTPAPAPAPVRVTPPPPIQTAPIQTAPIQTATVAPPPVAGPVPPPPSDTAATTALGESTDTTDTTFTADPTTTTAPDPTTTAAPPAAAAPPQGRRLIIPIILILVGIGVLIVLFRTST
jgi:hypothetical protein